MRLFSPVYEEKFNSILKRDGCLAICKWIGSFGPSWESKMAALNLYCLMICELENGGGDAPIMSSLSSYLTERSADDSLSAAIRFVKDVFNNNPDMQKSSPIIVAGPNSLSTVVTYGKLLHSYNEATGKPTDTSPGGNKERVTQLMTKIKKERKSTDSPLMFSNGKGFIWCTTREDIDKIVDSRTDAPEVADDIKKALGLIGAFEDYLVAIHYKHDPDNPVRKANVFHACFNPVFVSDFNHIEMGFTLNLETLGLGVKEGIIGDSPWPEFEYNPLGTAKCTTILPSRGNALAKRHRDRLEKTLSDDNELCEDFKFYCNQAGLD